jgi:alkanesulfonate monooxygenase SsuD/methylene tetrahydromethanopterin reductase-like flavin-dependent oxidoreductase (luciferase family)
MKFGIWHDFRNPPRWHRPYARLYQENLEQITWAEELGFDSVWLSEQHVTDEGYLPSSFPMLAALAERTRTMRLGTALTVASFHHPIRFAEDVAVLDQLSGGRLEIGVGLGYHEREFELLGVPMSERVHRTEALVETARRVWADGTVTPPPFQSPAPPLWIGGSAAASARRAVRLRCHFMPAVWAPNDVLDLYRDLGGSQLAVGLPVFVGRWSDVSEHYLHQHNRFAEWGGGQPLARAEDLPRDGYIVGSPAEVAAQLTAVVERMRCDHLVLWARPPGLDIALANRSLELFATEVMPVVAAASS